jgi:regulator of CtrA degradation
MVEQRFNGFIRIRPANPTGPIRQRNGPPIQAVMQGGRAVISEQGQMPSNMISLAERMVFSDSFKPIYAEGMDMVEEAASYLDGEGREDARNLSRVAATLYAAESMRLTTRLMQIASWLLLQRAARSGEMTRQQVSAEKAKVRLDTPSAGEIAQGWSELPAAFMELVERSMRLQARVRRMDREVYGEVVSLQGVPRGNPVSEQIVLLKTAFGAS